MRRTVQRGALALAIAASLSVAGARPAAAMDLGLMHQISSLWSFFIGAPSPAAHQTAAPSGKPVHRKSTSTTTDRGWGIDPNGNSLVVNPNPTSTGG